jgi:amidophosphoribosyltransferase
MFDKFHEECGVFGIYGHPEAAHLTYLGLHALQHRGQESAGIVSSDEKVFYQEKGMGLVSEVFSEERLRNLRGHMAIGHNRYSTTGQSHLKNAQPLLMN